MQTLTPEGLRIVTEIAARNGFSLEATHTLLGALSEGNGRQAQFRHPELGGMGQWSQGGMIMVGDMFNHDLKNRVDRICNELAALLDTHASRSVPSKSQDAVEPVSLFASGSSGGKTWWPADLGVPSSVGAQNDLRYAYFPDSRRVSIMRNGQVRVYDAGEHRITGFSQQQSGDQSLTFNSQLGLVRVEDLRLVPPPHDRTPTVASVSGASPERSPEASSPSPTSANPAEDPTSGPQPAGNAILSVIERLADLRQKNILTDEEFVAKKRELLSRL